MTDPQVIENLASFQVFAEAAIGYYRKLTEGGLPVDTVTRMTEEFHSALMRHLSSTIEVAKK